jgi:hypothetical protein
VVEAESADDARALATLDGLGLILSDIHLGAEEPGSTCCAGAAPTQLPDVADGADDLAAAERSAARRAGASLSGAGASRSSLGPAPSWLPGAPHRHDAAAE